MKDTNPRDKTNEIWRGAIGPLGGTIIWRSFGDEGVLTLRYCVSSELIEDPIFCEGIFEDLVLSMDDIISELWDQKQSLSENFTVLVPSVDGVSITGSLKHE